MGQLLCAEVLQPCQQARFNLVAALTHSQSSSRGQPSDPSRVSEGPIITDDYAGTADIIIDFSLPDGIPDLLGLAQQTGAALLIATTGYDDGVAGKIAAAAREIPILISANTSLGVNVTRHLAQQAIRKLGADTRVEIVEAHHKHKKDAPSGTALAIGEAIADAGVKIAPEQYHALRGGGVIGEHTVRFFGENEYLEIRHVATDRRLFATGALHAAIWLAKRLDAPGLYTMDDVLST